MNRFCNRFSVWPLFAVLVSFSVSGQAEEVQDGIQNNSEIVNEAIEKIEALKSTSDQRLTAFQSLFELSFDAREKVFLQLLNSKNEEYAAMAAQELIRSFPKNSATIGLILAKKIGSMLPRNQLVVLHAIASVRPVHANYLPVGRTVVQQNLPALDRLKKADTIDPTPLEIAFQILVKSEDKMDRKIVHEVINKFPESASLWWSLANSEIVDESLTRLATKVYQDDQMPLSARVAAATGLAANNEKALSFAVAEVAEFIMRFSHFDMATLMDPGQPPGKSYGDLVNQAQLLRSLYLLPADQSKDLTFSALKSKNLFFLVHVPPVAIIRWPNEFLDIAMTRQELRQPSFLIATVYFHPELEDRVKQSFPKVNLEQFDSYAKILEKLGPKLLSPFAEHVSVEKE